MPISEQAFTKRKNVSASKNSWVMMKSAPAATFLLQVLQIGFKALSFRVAFGVTCQQGYSRKRLAPPAQGEDEETREPAVDSSDPYLSVASQHGQAEVVMTELLRWAPLPEGDSW